jgi:hypothetical protein
MNVALWIVTGLLAVVYVASGGLKLILPKNRIAATGHAARWVDDFSPTAVKGIGALEVLGSLGLVLPAVLGIAPGLVPVAATGLALLMAGAVATRIRRRTYVLAMADLVYLLLAAFVAWGRFAVVPVAA